MSRRERKTKEGRRRVKTTAYGPIATGRALFLTFHRHQTVAILLHLPVSFQHAKLELIMVCSSCLDFEWLILLTVTFEIGILEILDKGEPHGVHKR